MDDYSICPIDSTYNDQMIPILKSSPINAGGLSLFFDKSPDIFEISRMKYSSCKHLGFFHNNDLKGFASMGYHDACIGGKHEKVFTLYHFYLLPEARGKHLSTGAVKLFLEDAAGKANFGYFITMKGNLPVESYIGCQRYSWAPQSGKIGELSVRSILFSLPHRNRTTYKVRNANNDDIPEIVRLLKAEHEKREFGHVFSEDSFKESLLKKGVTIEQYFLATDNTGRIRGVCLVWDCTSFRRTVILRYSSRLYPVLYIYRLLEKLMPMAPLPEEGTCFHELTITDCAAENRDRQVMHALLAEIYFRHRNRKYHFMNFGSCSNDDLLNAANGFLYQEVTSNIVLISLDPEKISIPVNLPYIDIGFL